MNNLVISYVLPGVVPGVSSLQAFESACGFTLYGPLVTAMEILETLFLSSPSIMTVSSGFMHTMSDVRYQDQ